MKLTISNSILVARIGLGWYFLYAGFSKIIDPTWTAVGYLTNAQTFPQFFEWLAGPVNIGWINFINEWGLFLIGLALIVGLLVRWASYAGIALMVLYWLPILDGVRAGHGLLVDEHIIYILLFIIFIAFEHTKNSRIDEGNT